MSTFSNGEYASCIDNCRTLFEKIIQKIDSNNNATGDAILNIVGESVIDANGNTLTSKKRIYEYWIQNKKGANRYRYFTTLYSLMSGLGTHGEEVPKMKDALMILRALEDVLVWILL